MLCERPITVQADIPFIPGCAPEKLEALGLTPIMKASALLCERMIQYGLIAIQYGLIAIITQIRAAKAVVKEPSTTATAIHREWIKGFDATQVQLRNEAERAQEAAQSKAAVVGAFSEKLRHAVLSGEKVSEFWKAAKARPVRVTEATEMHAPTPAVLAPSAGSALSMQQDVEDFVEQLCMEATASLATRKAATVTATAGALIGGSTKASPPAEAAAAAAPELIAEASTSESVARQEGGRGAGGKGGKKHGGGGGGSKPAWALSEGEAAVVQDEEEMQLLSFAEQLDFDSFIDKLDDVELQDTFKVGGTV